MNVPIILSGWPAESNGMLCLSYRATAVMPAVRMTADNRERALRCIEDHYGLASWNTALERRLRVAAPDVKDGSREVLITFEDLDAQGQAMGPLPSGYMGFTWSDSAWFITRAFSSSVCPGIRVGLLNANGRDITIESKRLFDLKGLSLCTLWTDKAQILIEGWEKQARKFATTQTVSRITTIQCAVDYRNIDRAELKTGGAHMVIGAINVLIR